MREILPVLPEAVNSVFPNGNFRSPLGGGRDTCSIAAMQSPQLDKYARDARAWRDGGKNNHAAAVALFETGNVLLYLPAATLGHHALEMYLKSALISEGMTVFNPVILKSLELGTALRRSDCAWGHCLVELARQLSGRRPDFYLSAEMNLSKCQTLLMPMTLEAAFGLFDPFFSELRYPQDIKKDTLCRDLKLVLDVLVVRLQPFLDKVR